MRAAANCQHWTWGFANHMLGDATHHHMSGEAAAMRSHDDQVDVALAGVTDDLGRRSARSARAEHVFRPEVALVVVAQELREQFVRGV